ncbi:MAG: thiamine diphosphokinase [Bacteroidaceae bacterium]|nr:thiamine diphosphokinase [Bacteroidaceae bacterium]
MRLNNKRIENIPHVFDAVILGNGDFPTYPVALQLLKNAPYLICCDGAANTLLAQGVLPNRIIGDGDSLSAANKEQYSDLFLLESSQETNDQTKAVHHCKALGKKSLLILGGTGKREDHTLGNISLLMTYQAEGMDVVMLTDNGLFLPCKDNCCFTTTVGQPISIFNCSAQQLKGSGLEYPLYDFSQPWQGTLNVATAEKVQIEAKGCYLVYLAFSA